MFESHFYKTYIFTNALKGDLEGYTLKGELNYV